MTTMARDGLEGDMSSLDISTTSTGYEEFTDRHEAQFQAIDMPLRARLLLDELSEFQQYLKDRKREDAIYLRAFKSDVQQELKLLEKVE
jgi:hypothetical protein